MMATWITTAEAVLLTGYNHEYVRVLIRKRKIKAKKFGPVWQVEKESLLRYAQEAGSTGDQRFGAHSQPPVDEVDQSGV
jgi:hypothetical protein